MSKWTRLVVLTFILLVLLLTARFWLPPLLAFVGANSDTIQGLEALVQLVLLALTAIAGFLGLREWRKQREPRRASRADDHPGHC